MTVQIFVAPRQGSEDGYKLADIVSKAYEKHTTVSGVWFQRVRYNEIGLNGGWYQINVSAVFSYDQLR